MRRAQHTIRIFSWQLDSMPEYSSTLPTGTTIGKIWKRKALRGALSEWVVGQYYSIDLVGHVGIRWFAVTVLEGPMPVGWQAPDWSNYEGWKRRTLASQSA